MGCNCGKKVIRKSKPSKKTKQSLPGLSKMVSNVTKSAVGVLAHVVKTGRIQASKDVIKQRLKTCKECEFLFEDIRCSVCGCFINLKIGLESEECPKKKW